MSTLNRLIRRLGRGETPIFRFAKKAIQRVFYPVLPPLPRLLLSPLRVLYEIHFTLIAFWRSFVIVTYSNPLFQSRCATFGRGVQVQGLPFVSGPVEIQVGDKVILAAKVSILSGNMLERPQLILKDHSGLGWGTTVVVNKEVILEEHVIIAPGCRISDSDGHPREADLRAAGERPHLKDVKPIRICKFAWVGTGSYVMKGVTIGEGAIVAANSVVMTNIPAYSLAVGNPAEVLFRNYGRPSTEKSKP